MSHIFQNNSFPPKRFFLSHDTKNEKHLEFDLGGHKPRILNDLADNPVDHKNHVAHDHHDRKIFDDGDESHGEGDQQHHDGDDDNNDNGDDGNGNVDVHGGGGRDGEVG